MSAQSSSTSPSASPSTPPSTPRSKLVHNTPPFSIVTPALSVTPETVVRGVAMDVSSLHSSLTHLEGDPQYQECGKDSEAIRRGRLLKEKILLPRYTHQHRSQILLEFDLLLQLAPEPVRVSTHNVVELVLHLPSREVRKALLLEMLNLLYFQLQLTPDSASIGANEAREIDVTASMEHDELEEDIDLLESWVLSGIKEGTLSSLRAVGFSRNADGVLLMVITVLAGTDYKSDVRDVREQKNKLGLAIQDLDLEIRVLENYGESIPCSETDVQSDDSDEPKPPKDSHYEDAVLTIDLGKDITSTTGVGTIGLIVEITDPAMIHAATERFPSLIPHDKKYAIITAAHVVPRSGKFSYCYGLRSINATELSLVGVLTRHLDVPDLALLCVHADEELNAETLNTIASQFMCSYDDPTHKQYVDEADVIEGKITKVWNTPVIFRHELPNIKIGQRVYMLGKHNKVFGSFVGIERVGGEQSYHLICDIKAQKGDSGALLFITSDKQNEVIGIGILSKFTPLPKKDYGIYGTKFVIIGELNRKVYRLPGVAVE